MKDKKKDKRKNSRRESVKSEMKEKKKSAKDKNSPKVSSSAKQGNRLIRGLNKHIARLNPSPTSPGDSPKNVVARENAPEHTKVVVHPKPFR